MAPVPVVEHADVLNLVSFAALMDELDRYLIERYSLTYLASGRDLVHKPPSLLPRRGPLIIADPSYTLAPLPTPAPVSADRESTTRSSVYPCQPLSRLSGARTEARELHSLLDDATLWTRTQATETALSRVQGPSILHIATHAFFLSDQQIARDSVAMDGFSDDMPAPRIPLENGLLRSGLLLAGASQCRGTVDQTGAYDDGVLTALEASSLDLRGTRLVVLSACVTGMGEVKMGQGIYGLRRAFRVAGAETLVMSLWSVSDSATAYLMRRYYENLRHGHGRSDAMRAVQLDLIAQGGARMHPYYWASFMVSGDDATLDGKPPHLRVQPVRDGGCAGCASRVVVGSAWLFIMVVVALGWRIHRAVSGGSREEIDDGRTPAPPMPGTIGALRRNLSPRKQPTGSDADPTCS